MNTTANLTYTTFLRESVLEARADTRPALPSEAAKKHMDEIKAQHLVQLDIALDRKPMQDSRL